jgi:hypothetical protein
MTYVPADDRYEHLRYRRSGRSGLQLPAVSLGLWQNFGYDRPLDTSRAIGPHGSRDAGKTWGVNLRARLMGLALNPADPTRVLAAGPGVLLSTNGGGSWKKVLDIHDGGGPVAWSKRNPKIAYVVGFDRTLYRSTDSGRTWSAVE